MKSAYQTVCRSLQLARLKLFVLMAVVPVSSACAAFPLKQHIGLNACCMVVVAVASLLAGAYQERGLRRIERVRTRLYRHMSKLARSEDC